LQLKTYSLAIVHRNSGSFEWIDKLCKIKFLPDLKKLRKGHFFNFEVWNKSMDVKYLIDAFLIIVIGTAVQAYSDSLNDKIVKQTDYGNHYRSLAAQLLDPTLPLLQRLALLIEFQTYEDFWANEGDEVLRGFIILMYIHLGLSAYLFQN
jgi:hypothetical protein